MTPLKVDAEIKAGLQVAPDRSNIYLVMLGSGALCSLGAVFVFLWHKPELCWVPFLLVLVFLISGWLVWSKSHKNIDMSGAEKTVISNAQSGVILSTDTRALNSSDNVQALARLISLMGHREPLPEPSGMLDSNGHPLPNSKADASRYIDQVNAAVQKETADVAKILSGSDRSELHGQPVIDVVPPTSIDDKNRGVGG